MSNISLGKHTLNISMYCYVDGVWSTHKDLLYVNNEMAFKIRCHFTYRPVMNDNRFQIKQFKEKDYNVNQKVYAIFEINPSFKDIIPTRNANCKKINIKINT